MEKFIQVAPRERLLSLDAIDGLADCLTGLTIPRRQVPEWMAGVLHDWIGNGGSILDGKGEQINIYPGIVDDAHGEDGSFCWVSAQRRRQGANAPRRRWRQSMCLRLQLYDAAFRIAFGKSIVPDGENPTR